MLFITTSTVPMDYNPNEGTPKDQATCAFSAAKLSYPIDRQSLGFIWNLSKDQVGRILQKVRNKAWKLEVVCLATCSFRQVVWIWDFEILAQAGERARLYSTFRKENVIHCKSFIQEMYHFLSFLHCPVRIDSPSAYPWEKVVKRYVWRISPPIIGENGERKRT